MIKDPLTSWDGLFPYDALAQVGITPDSSMKEVIDASFDLMAKGEMSPEVRRAWDELRIKDKRLLVDFFLYQFDPREDSSGAAEKLNDEFERLAEVPDLSRLVRVTLEDLGLINQDVREIPIEGLDLNFVPEFESEPLLPDAGFIRFDDG